MPATIRLTWDDPTTGDRRELAAALPITIGRGPYNTLPLNSTVVSREHARLETEGNRLLIQDLGSTNGIFINGQRVQSAYLQDGELFQIGPFTFTILVETLPPPPETITLQWRKSDDDTVHTVTLPLPIEIGRSDENTLPLPGPKVSRHHATINWQDGNWVLVDNASTNGTYLNGERCGWAIIPPDNEIQIGDYLLRVLLPETTPQAADDDQTQPGLPSPARALDQTAIYSPALDESDPGGPPTLHPREPIPAFPPPLFSQYQLIPLAELQQLDLPLEETTYLTLGGGLGSFIWVDHLLICGVKPAEVVAIGVEPKPYSRFQRLAVNSQILADVRLRSSSDACPDNLWGWPGYALREIWRDLKQGRLSQALHLAWQIFGEPDLAETYTPRSGDVIAAIERETARIGWERIWRFGRVRAIRKTDDERYVIAYSQTRPGAGRIHKLILARYLHLAVGYPAVRFLPDLQQYREKTHDFKSVVNAYEEHNHVYEHLRLHGGTVLVRGRGIVAARIIQRLAETRRINADIHIIHLMQIPVFKGSNYGRARRSTYQHWEYQAFSWPKACWGGDLRFLLEKVPDDDRDQLLNDLGGTTTPHNSAWAAMLEAGLREGWYKIRFGSVERVERDETTGKLNTIIRGKTALEGSLELLADFIIDATGLAANLEGNPLLKDLVQHYHLPRNIKDRLKVTTDFEVAEMRNGRARMFASGVATLGGAFAPVDSFLGLQYAALRSLDLLARERIPGLLALNAFRSALQWLRWARGVAP